MRKGLSDLLDEIKEMQKNDINSLRAIEILKLFELRRIADELTAIDTALVTLLYSAEELESCITKTRGGSFLSITGNVTNYVG